MKKNIILFLAILMLSPNLEALAASKYVPVTFVTGIKPDLELELHEKSFNLDLLKTDAIRARVKVNDLYTSVDSLSSFTIKMYEVVGGQREFISSQSLNIKRGASNNRVLSIQAGFFATSSKVVEFDLLDTENNLINTYTATLNATNLGAQPSEDSGIDFADASCPSGTFGDCQLNKFFERVQFRVLKQRQASVRVQKDQNNIYTVTIPVPRDPFNFLRGNRIRGVKGVDNGGNGTTADFGETIDASIFRAGPAGTGAVDHGKISYDPTNNQLEIGFATAANTLFSFGDDGKFGLGVDDPTAYLHVRNGNTSNPPILIEDGSLTTTPQNGALEFDGTNLYFTKNNVRSVIGAAGPQGPQGPTGATGATGPQGPAGPAGGVSANTVNSSSIVNGSVASTDLGPNSVLSSHIANGAVATADLADAAVTDAKVVSVSSSKITGITPVAFDPTPIDINGITTIDVTGKNFVKITDSATGSLDTLHTITGGTPGQRIIIQLLANMRFQVDNIGTANSIQWGLGTAAGPRTHSTREAFEFVYDGNAWYLIARFLL